MADARLSTGDDDLAVSLYDIFKWSMEQQSKDINRLKSLQDTHDNKFAEDVWPTVSKIPIADAWRVVEEATGPALDYLVPSSPFVRFLPSEPTPTDELRKMEWAFYLQLVHRMRIKHAIHRSVKDCFKVGVGYAIVEPFMTSPTAIREITAGGNVARMMAVGAQQVALRVRYVSPGKVVPYPSGTDFNGEDATPYSFFLDIYSENDFKAMYSGQPHDGENASLMGNVDEIIADSRSGGFTTGTTIEDFVNRMGGTKSRINTGRPTEKNVPGVIPVLKCFQKNRHTWLYLGSMKKVLFDREGKFDTMRNPMIKFDAWQDSDRWYGMSEPEANQRNVWANNVWFNLLFDLATKSLKRTLVYDNSDMDTPPIIRPDGSVGIPGDVKKTMAYLDPPGVDQGIVMVGDRIDSIISKTTGQRDFTQRNFTRGGSMAFQDLVQSTEGRSMLRYSLLQMGGLESIALQTLIYMQTRGAEMNLNFQRPAISEKEKREYVEHFSITENDLKHNFTLMLDLDSKFRTGTLDKNLVLQKYQVKASSQFIDQYEALEDLFDDEATLMRQRLPREEVERREQEKRAAELQGMAGGQAPAGTPVNPALAGAVEGGNV